MAQFKLVLAAVLLICCLKLNKAASIKRNTIIAKITSSESASANVEQRALENERILSRRRRQSEATHTHIKGRIEDRKSIRVFLGWLYKSNSHRDNFNRCIILYLKNNKSKNFEEAFGFCVTFTK